jgi:DNA-binding response OmpR family regulator
MKPRVLIADDERDVATIVAYGVRMMWPDAEVETAADGVEALRRFDESQPDLVVLDVSMPPPDGFAVLERIRAVSQVPVLMLTAYGATADKVRAFDLGADDYLTKPFDHLELLARLRALLRRTQSPETADGLPEAISIDNLTLDPATRQVHVGERTAALTATEYRLLEELVRHAGRSLPHEYLLTRVWGPEYRSDVATLRVCVLRLRAKLSDDGEAPGYIHTERGTGYRFLVPR